MSLMSAMAATTAAVLVSTSENRAPARRQAVTTLLLP